MTVTAEGTLWRARQVWYRLLPSLAFVTILTETVHTHSYHMEPMLLSFRLLV